VVKTGKTGKKRKKRKAKKVNEKAEVEVVEVETIPEKEVLDAQAKILGEICSDLRKLSSLLGVMAKGQVDSEEVS
jgi:hypothetical protein